MPVRKLILAIVTFVAFAILGGGQTVMSQLIYSNDFEDDPVGIYSASNLDADWNSPPFSNGVDEGRVSIVSDASGKYLEVTYPEGLFGSGDDETGAQWKLEFGQGYEAVELEYRVKFGAGFDFVRGGKLPGLIGGEGNVGGNVPDGTDGFSARMMWRTDGSGGSNLTPNKANIVQYVYHPDQPNTFGEDFRWDDGPQGIWKEFESDRWYHLRHRVVMNTPGQNDGIIMAWLDGELVLNVNNIRFRDVASLQIDQMYFSTFFGGGTSIWATTKDEVAYFDDFRITVVLTPAPIPQTVFDDSFADGDRAETNTGSENDTSWWTSSSSAGDELNIGPPNTLGLVTGSSGRGIHTVFPTQTLTNVGDKLTATYTFTTPATVNPSGSSGAFRVGLFDTLGRAGLNADVSASSGSPNALYGWAVANGGPGDAGLPGYMFDMDVNTGASADLNFRTHNVGSATGRLMQTTGSGSFSSFSSGPDEGYTFDPNTSYTGSFSIERISPTELQLTGTLGSVSYTLTDTTFTSTSFGFLGFHVNSNQFGSSNTAGQPDNGIDFSNINVTFTAGIVLGDANDDGVLDNFDIAPFVLALTDATAYAAAFPGVDPDVVLDMNGDGSFNNLDISGFVAALIGPPDLVPRQVLFGENGSWPVCYKLSEYYNSPDVDLSANPDYEVTDHFEAAYDENDIPVIKSFVIWSGDTTPNSNNPRVEIQMKPACAVDAYTTDMRLCIRSRVISLSPMGPNATKPFETVTLGQIHQLTSQSNVETDITTIGYRGPTRGMVIAAGGSWASNITVDANYALGDIFEAELILSFGGVISYTYENLTTGVTSSGTVGTLPGSNVGDVRFQGFNYLQQEGRDYSGNDGSEVWLYKHEVF